MNITVRVMTKQAQAMLANLERQLTTTSRVASTAQFGGAQAAIASRGFKALGNSMQWAGYQLLHAFTIPLVAAGGMAMKYELDNERAFAGVKKVYGDAALAAQDHGAVVRNELVALRKEFVALSDVYGVSQTDVIKIGEAWAAAGVSGEALGKSVENTMKTMVIGDLDAVTATKALISIQAQYGASTSEMTKILAAMNVAENITGASMGDLIQGFSNSASVAAAAGVDYRHLTAMITALVPAQGTATKAGNALKTIFTDLLVPTKKATDALAAMGINVDDASWRSLTATQRLELLSRKFKQLDGNQKVIASNYIAGKYQISRFDQSMADLGKSFDAQGKYLGDNSKALGYYGKTLAATKNAQNNAKIAQQELNTVLSSNPQKLRQVWTVLKNDAGAAVAGLVPFLIQFVTLVAGLVHWFGNLNPVIQRWVAILIIALALLGPILLYIAAISKLMGVLGTVFRTGAKAVGWFFGLFNADKRTISRLSRDIAGLKAELDSLTSVTAIEKLEAELNALDAQLLELKYGAEESFREVATASTAATEQIVRNNELVASTTSKAEYERAAAAQAATAKRIADEKAWLAAAVAASRESASVYGMSAGEIVQESTAAAADVTLVWEASAEGIVATFITVAEQISAITAGMASANIMAAQASAEGWVRAQAIIAAAAKTAKDYQVAAMLEQLTVMRSSMGVIDMTATTWARAGILEAASVDQVTASLLIQLQTLRAIQLQALRTSQTMLTAGAASAGTALVPMRGAAAGAGAVERYGAEATAGAAGAAGATRAASGKLYAETRTATAKTEGIFARSVGRIGGFFKSGFMAIGRFINMALMGIPAAVGRFLLIPFTAAAAAISAPVWVIIAAVALVIAEFLIFRHQITAVAKAVAREVADMAHGVWNGLKAIGGFFADMANWVIRSIGALPHAIVSIMQAVVRIIGEAAHQVYELFSYMNPFAHHSPSLVENVDKGMDYIGKKFAGISGSVSASMKGAYADIKRFGAAIAGLVKTDEQLKQAADIQLLSKYAPQAVAGYRALAADLSRLTDEYNKLGAAIEKQQAIVDAQQAVVDKLNDKLDDEADKLTALQAIQSKYSDALDASKQKLSDYANAPIKGMKAMNDQIFANEMAQKALQLQMDKMEDAVGPIDKVQSKLDSLSGQIEKLRGEEASLRAGGAGSDILAAYDKQIAALEGQQNGIKTTVDNYQKMQDALAELQRQGEELGLEQSLKFDPLTKQIEDLTNASKELPFEDIVKGIKDTQAEVDKNTAAYNKATDAVTRQQKVVDGLTASRDAQQKILDTEQKKLDALNKVYQKVGDTIQAVTDAMGKMTDAANDMADAASKAAGAGNVLGSAGNLKSAGGKNTLGRVGGNADQSDKIEKDTQKYLDSLKGLFNKMDLFGGLKDKFKAVGNWIKKWIWEEPAKWGDWITAQVKRLGSLLWGWVGEGVSNVGHWIAEGWNVVVNFFENLPGTILDLVKSLPHLLVANGRKLIYGLGYGIGYGLGMIVRLMLAVPTLIVKGFIGAGKWLFHHGGDIMRGLRDGLIWGLKFLIRVLVGLPVTIERFFLRANLWLARKGRDIIVGLGHGISAGAKAIWAWLKALPGNIVSFLADSPHWLATTGLNMIKGLWHGIQDGWNWLWDKVSGFISGLVNGFMDALGIHSPSTVFAEIGKNILQGLWDGIVYIASGLFQWFINLPGNIISTLGDVGSWLVDKGKDVIGSFRQNGGGLLGGIYDGDLAIAKFFANLPSNILKWIGDATKWLGTKGRDIIGHFRSDGGGLLGGIYDGDVAIGNFFKNLPGNIIKWIGDAGRWLITKGSEIIGAWGRYTGLLGGLHHGWDAVATWFGNLPSWIGGFFAKAGTWLLKAGGSVAQGLIDGVKNALQFLAKVFGTPIYWAVRFAINPIITGLNYIPGVDIPKLDASKIPHFRRGGKVPGAHDRDDVLVYTTPGEVIVPKDIVKQSGGAAELMKMLGFYSRGGGAGDHFASGGPVGGTPNRGGGASNSVALKALRDMGGADIFKGFANWIGDQIDTVSHLMREGAGTIFVNTVANPLKKFDNYLDKWGEPGRIIDHAIDDSLDKVSAWIFDQKKLKFDSTVGNHGMLIDQALQYAKQALSPSNEYDVDTIVRYESGWNPKAINNSDSNARAGHPSQGLMQTIPSTFEAYRLASLPNDITSPIANLVAGIRYAVSRYGSLDNVPGIVSLRNGGKYVGYDAGGLLPTGISQVINNTGAPEVIAPQKTFDQLFSRVHDSLSDKAWSKLNMRSGGAGGDASVVNNYTTHNETTNITFTGDLTFPNITDPGDAGELLSNLESMVNK